MSLRCCNSAGSQRLRKQGSKRLIHSLGKESQARQHIMCDVVQERVVLKRPSLVNSLQLRGVEIVSEHGATRLPSLSSVRIQRGSIYLAAPPTLPRTWNLNSFALPLITRPAGWQHTIDETGDEASGGEVYLCCSHDSPVTYTPFPQHLLAILHPQTHKILRTPFQQHNAAHNKPSCAQFIDALLQALIVTS